MKTQIMILVEVDNANINYSNLVAYTKSEIISYFGTKNSFNPSQSWANIIVTSEVTQEDIDELIKRIDNPSVRLLAIKACDESTRFSGDMIDLT